MALAEGARHVMHMSTNVLEQPQPAAARPLEEPQVASLAPELPTSASPLRAFRNRDFLLLCTGAFVSNIGTWMERVAVGVWTTESTGLAAATGLVTAMLFVPVAVLGPIGGALSERTDRRSWLIAVTIAQAAVAALLAALASAQLLSVPLVCVLMVLTGCTSVLLSAGFNALVAELVPKKDLTSAMFLNSGQWNLARVVGPLIAAPIMQYGSPALAFWVNAASFGAVLLAVVYMRIPQRRVQQAHEPLRTALASGARVASTDPGISSALLITAVAGFFIAPFIGLVPVFAIETLHQGRAAASLLVTAQGVGAVIAALLSASQVDRVGAGTWMRMSCAALTLLSVAFWLAPSLGWALLAMVLLGAAYLSLVTGAGRVCLGRAPSGAQARLASLYHATLDATYAFGLLAAGAAGDVVGLRRVGVASSLLFGVLLVVLARSRRHLFTSL
jgi:MFS family permease